MRKRDELKSYGVFSLLILLFITPILMTWIASLGTEVKKLFGTHHHGELISLYLPVSTLQLKNVAGQPFVFTPFENKWILLYLNDSSCGQPCKTNLMHMQQVKKTLAAQGQPLALLWVKTVEPTASDAWLADKELQIPLGESSIEVSPSKTNHYYLADPAGNIILSYEVDISPALIVEDIKRLLSS